MTPEEQAARHPIFRCITGSRAHGLATAASDLDVRGVFAAAPIGLMTPFHPTSQVDGPGDTVLFELMKYVRLVCDQNPNIVELLWVDQSDVLFDSPSWQMLRDLRADLLTTKVRSTYGGFAAQAMKQMASRDRWLSNPQPEAAPRPCDFVSMVHDMSPDGSMGTEPPVQGNWTAVSIGNGLFLLHAGGRGSWYDAGGNLRPVPAGQAAALVGATPASALLTFNRKAYEQSKKDHTNYWTWRRERDPVRGAAEARIGYDPKNASHLIRLLRMAREIMTDGIVRVRRPDAAELMSIRRGEVSYDRIVGMAAELENDLDRAAMSCTLPADIDQTLVGDVVMCMYERTWADAALRTHVAAVSLPFENAAVPDIRGRIVVLDLEMTGYADPGCNQIVEIGAVEIMGGRVTGRTFHAHVDPRSRQNPHATKVHGLTEGFLRGKPTFPEIASDFLAFVGDSPIASHRAAIDARAMNNDLSLAGLAPMDPERFACTERLAGNLLGTYGMGLDSLCDAFAVDRTPRDRGHAAALDASLLAGCLLGMAAMPGYQEASGVWLNKDSADTRASRRVAGREQSLRAQCVSTSLSGDGTNAVFRLGGGERIEEPLPPFPHETHHAVALGPCVMAIVRTDSRTPRPVPDNPDGPALVIWRKGRILHLWTDGDPSTTPCPDETLPLPGRP